MLSDYIGLAGVVFSSTSAGPMFTRRLVPGQHPIQLRQRSGSTILREQHGQHHSERHQVRGLDLNGANSITDVSLSLTNPVRFFLLLTSTRFVAFTFVWLVVPLKLPLVGFCCFRRVVIYVVHVQLVVA